SDRVGHTVFIGQFAVIAFVIREHHVHDKAGEENDQGGNQNRKPQAVSGIILVLYSSGDSNVKTGIGTMPDGPKRRDSSAHRCQSLPPAEKTFPPILEWPNH